MTDNKDGGAAGAPIAPVAPSPAERLAIAHERVRRSFARYAAQAGRRTRLRAGYLADLARKLRFYVPPGADCLELGVGTGDLLAAVRPRRGVGIDLVPEMLAVARERHPELELHELAAEDVGRLQGPFDYVILSDLTVHLYDIRAVLRGLAGLVHPRTRLVFSFHSRLWQPVLGLLAALGLHQPPERMNWVTVEDLVGLLGLAGYEVVRIDAATLVPARVPLLAWLANRFLVHLPLLSHLALVNWIVARPRLPFGRAEELSYSVVCPCRNEAGNVPEIVRRLPRLGRRTELIFVEGHSTDGTWEAVQAEAARPSRGDLEVRALRQSGQGKADAVRKGFAEATGDVLAILDADLTVPPETLPEFASVLAEGHGELVSGSRLVYPMEDRAMRFLNIAGNKFFARLFSYLLGQRIKDTLCGTKVIARADYERLVAGRAYFGEFDPFGDFDLLFGASKLNLKLVELPVRYGARVYGETNIRRFRDGLLLLRMSWFALWRLKLQ